MTLAEHCIYLDDSMYVCLDVSVNPLHVVGRTCAGCRPNALTLGGLDKAPGGCTHTKALVAHRYASAFAVGLARWTGWFLRLKGYVQPQWWRSSHSISWLGWECSDGSDQGPVRDRLAVQ